MYSSFLNKQWLWSNVQQGKKYINMNKKKKLTGSSSKKGLEWGKK